MTQLDDRPDLRTDPGARLDDGLDFEPRRPQQPAGRIVSTVLLLLAVLVGAGLLGFMLAGGRLVGQRESTANVPATIAPSAAAPALTQAPPTAQPAPTQAPPIAQPAPPAPPPPTAAPTSPPPTAIPPTPVPPTPVPPTPVPPTPVPPTAPPAPTAIPVPVAAPAAAPAAAPPGAGVAVRPGMDARQAQIEGKVREYFDALGAEDYQRAQQVCCSAEWRARYPLDQWRRNFDGVTDLKLTNPPRYLKQSDDEVVVDTDYTFVSGGARRNFTLRWTFKPSGPGGNDWQADLAEAFPTP